MNKPNIFFRLTKVDVAKREVTGIATAELPDQTGEICDYETTKPFYQKWSANIAKASGGKSLGNVREMHGNIAAGKVIDLQFDDAKRLIRIVTKCVDDSTWNKIIEGVLTGFSQAGDYVKKWKDGDHMRYTADPSEISYVDNPCLFEATFEIVKADGSTEMHKFKTQPVTVTADVEQVWKAQDGSTWATKVEAKKQNQLIAARAAVAKTTDGVQTLLNGIEDLLDKREFSDDERKKAADAGEALPDGSFPIQSEQDLKNAIRAVGRASDPAKAKAHIIARAKAMGLESELPTDWEGSTKPAKAKDATMKKDLCMVARVAHLLEELNWLHTSVEIEEAWEEDESSDAPDHLSDIVKELCSFLVTYIEEETAEIVEDKGGTGIEMPMAMSAGHAAALAKAAKFVTFPGGMSLSDEKDFSDRLGSLVAALEKSAKEKDEPDMPADHMEHVNAIHKAAGHIMKKCMKCMGAEATEKMLKAMAEDDELKDHINAIHKKASHIADHTVALGSKIEPDADDKDDDDDSDDEGTEKFMKMAAENSALTKALTGMSEQLAEIQKRLVVVENQPMPRKGRTMIITKGHEREDEPEERVAETRHINISGLSPEEARSLLI